MKLIANDYDEKETFKIIREWTGLTQQELSESMGHKGRSWAKGIESGKNRFYFSDILKIAKRNGITITFEKNKSKVN